MIVASASRVRWPPDRVPTRRALVEVSDAQLLGRELGATIRVPGVVDEGELQRCVVGARGSGVVEQVTGQPLHLGDCMPEGAQGRGEHVGDQLPRARTVAPGRA